MKNAKEVETHVLGRSLDIEVDTMVCRKQGPLIRNDQCNKKIQNEAAKGEVAIGGWKGVSLFATEQPKNVATGPTSIAFVPFTSKWLYYFII